MGDTKKPRPSARRRASDKREPAEADAASDAAEGASEAPPEKRAAKKKGASARRASARRPRPKAKASAPAKKAPAKRKKPAAKRRPSVPPPVKTPAPEPPAQTEATTESDVEAAWARADAVSVPLASAPTPARSAPSSSPSARPKSLRSPASRDPNAEHHDGAVLITGICGRLGRLLARTLHRQDRVVGIDRRAFRGKPKDIVHHQIDLRRKKTRDVFRAGGIRAVVHLGIMHDLRASAKAHHAWNVVAFQKLLDYMTQYNVPKLVLLSSANVYGPSPDNPQFLTEEAPLLGAQQFSAIRDLVEVDMLAQSFFWRHPDTETVVLRPCHILGGVRNAASNYLRLERPVSLMGFDPMVQVIHERDVVRAIAMALQPGVRGIFNLRGPGEVPMSRVFRLLGKQPRSVPSSLARPVLERMWRYRMTSFPTPELDHIRYVCMVDDTRARDVLGFNPVFGLEDTVRAVELEA